MKKRFTLLAGVLSLFATAGLAQPVLETGSVKPMPAVWIDKDTGHKIMRLNGPNGAPISNWYFHNNPFFVAKGNGGDVMVFASSDAKNVRQVFALNLKTLKSEQLTFGSSPKRLYAMSAQKTQEYVFQTADSVFGGNPFTKKTRLLYVFPQGQRGSLATINADATFFAGSLVDPKQSEILREFPLKSQYFDKIYDAHLMNSIFTVNIKTDEFKVIHEENNWLGHIQFSPTDPNVLMFCHEGPWQKVDRIWRYTIDSKETTLMHKRTVPGEIAGHEFFQPDGKVIWFDLQKPAVRSPEGVTTTPRKFYLAGAQTKDGKPVARYEMTPDEWSIHFAIHPEKNLFAGDGGDPSQVARAKDGMWIYAFWPDGDKLKSERLVNMKTHVYRGPNGAGLEPNVHITPDAKWVIFGGTFEGQNQTYAVEIAKSK